MVTEKIPKIVETNIMLTTLNSVHVRVDDFKSYSDINLAEVDALIKFKAAETFHLGEI